MTTTEELHEAAQGLANELGRLEHLPPNLFGKADAQRIDEAARRLLEAVVPRGTIAPPLADFRRLRAAVRRHAEVAGVHWRVAARNIRENPPVSIDLNWRAKLDSESHRWATLAIAVRDAAEAGDTARLRGLRDELAEVVGDGAGGAEAPGGGVAEDESQPPALTESERITLRTLALFDASDPATVERIADETLNLRRLSKRTVQKAMARLVELALAERPHGKRGGARLTIAGRRRAATLRD